VPETVGPLVEAAHEISSQLGGSTPAAAD
jgi:hypothetical protein